MLHGSPAEAPFGDAEAARVIAGTRTLHFAPGTRHSYVNQNFRLLSDIVQDRTGRGFAELLRTGVFERAGMATAFLAADTRAMPDGTEGYEGTATGGFRAAENRILWTGDAGLGASLDDMIAWERHIDATRDDAGSLYRRLSAPVSFADGSPGGLRLRPEPGHRTGPDGHRPWRRAARLAQPPDLRAVGARLRRRHVQPPVGRARRRGGPARRRAGRRTATSRRCRRRAGLARRLYRTGDRACRAHRCAGRKAPAALRSFPGTPRPACRRHRRQRQRQRAASPRRWRAVDGPAVREPDLAPATRSTARPPWTSPAATAARSWTPS